MKRVRIFYGTIPLRDTFRNWYLFGYTKFCLYPNNSLLTAWTNYNICELIKLYGNLFCPQLTIISLFCFYWCTVFDFSFNTCRTTQILKSQKIQCICRYCECIDSITLHTKFLFTLSAILRECKFVMNLESEIDI